MIFFCFNSEVTQFLDIVDEIYEHVDSVGRNPSSFLSFGKKNLISLMLSGPFVLGNCARVPSSAYCILVKLFLMKIHERQLKELLYHKDSIFIRAIGVLFLRYTCPPDKLWDYLGPLVDVPDEFKPEREQKM